MTRRTLSTTLLGASLAAGLVAAPAAGATTPGPWQEYRSAGFSVPAGARCAFALSSTVIDDHERIRTLETYADGSPRTQEVVGQLVVRYTNEDTQQSIKRNLTGNALVDLRPDGSLSRMTLEGGHFAVGFREQDPAGPAFLVFTGAGHSVAFADDGTRTVTYGNGGVEDICDTLAG